MIAACVMMLHLNLTLLRITLVERAMEITHPRRCRPAG